MEQRMIDCYLRKCMLMDLENLTWRNAESRFIHIFVIGISSSILCLDLNAKRVENILQFDCRI